MTTERAQLSAIYGEEERLRAELKEARDALDREIDARCRLERAVIDVTDAERARLAQMLHDTICQSLTGISLLSRVVMRRLENAGREEAVEVRELGRVVDEANREIHSVVGWLRPSPLDGADVIAALSDLAPSLFRGIPCEFHCPNPVVLSDRAAAAQLIQIVNQAVNDALQRPGIQRIAVSLSTQDRRVTLMVRDDGAPAGAAPSAAALAGQELLRLRAGALGAALTISSQDNQGTTLICKLPQSN
jgi:signal transduction histidine kinase